MQKPNYAHKTLKKTNKLEKHKNVFFKILN